MRILSQTSDRQIVQLVLVCSSQDEKNSLTPKGCIAVEGVLAHISDFFESDVLQCKRCDEFDHIVRIRQNLEECLNCSELGNGMAHNLAHAATELGRAPMNKKITLKENRKPDTDDPDQERAIFQLLNVARHLRSLDAVLPGRHVRKLPTI